MTPLEDALARAAAHDLHVDPSTAELLEAGLDFRVVLAAEPAGRRWVLRVPRRPDVAAGLAAERRILDLVAPALAAEGVAVPDWQVQAADLVAYPALPGSPGLTLTEDLEPEWHLDPTSTDYAARLGRLLARLHAIDVKAARAAGLEVRDPARVREAWREDVARVLEAFPVAPVLAETWEEWLADDACWPDRTVLTHGELYPAHVLLDPDGKIRGVLDWTTARVDDPARDLSFQHGAGGDAALEATLASYADAGGTVSPGTARQAGRLWDAAPLGYALFALTTGDPEHHAAARAQLAATG